MSCRGTQRVLSPYMDGACSDRERARVEEHLQGCASCSALLRELQRTRELVSALPEKRASDGFMPALSSSLRALEQAPSPGLLRRALLWLGESQVRWQTAAAGALVLLIAVGVFGVLQRNAEAPASKDLYLSSVVERHRGFAAGTLPFDDRALTYASYQGGL